MQVRSAAESASKFVKRASAARDDYKNGVSNAGQRWQAGAEASEDAWRTGTQDAINQGRFVKGVRKAGGGKYQNNAVKLGPDRFATGVSNAEQAYNAGVAPYLGAMSSADYGPRGARGSSQNRDRIGKHIDLMRKTRSEQLGISS
jgi:hypothetical protein